VDWLAGFVGRHTWPNNWVLFQTVVEEFLASVGGPYHESEILRGLETMEQWYLGNGWYTDGADRRVDHYNAWAFHFYPLLWTRIAETGDRADLAVALKDTYRARLRFFLTDYVHLVGGDGAPMHQGRSLTYRFAASVPFWMGELFDCSPLRPGVSRRAASGMLRYFAGHSVPDGRGLLTSGWHRSSCRRPRSTRARHPPTGRPRPSAASSCPAPTRRGRPPKNRCRSRRATG